MGFKDGLVGLVLGGALSFGGGEKAKADYIEDFDFNPGWSISNSSKIHQTTFQGDWVLRFEVSEYDFAFISVERHQGKPFILKWDAYVESTNLHQVDFTYPTEAFRFGIFGNPSHYFGDDDALRNTIRVNDYNIIPSSLITNNLDYVVGTQGELQRKAIIWGGGAYNELIGEWIHNIIKYGPEKETSGMPITTFSVYRGKGNEEDLYRKIQLAGSGSPIGPHVWEDFAPYYNNFKGGLIGINLSRWRSTSGGVTSAGYIDNVYFDELPEEIPEPTTSLLLGAGLGLSWVLASRRKLTNSK